MESNLCPQEVRAEIERNLDVLLNEEPILLDMKIAELAKKFKEFGITKKGLREQLGNLHQRIRNATQNEAKEVDRFDELPPGVVIPFPYRLKKNGVEKTSFDKHGEAFLDRITPTPLFVSQKSKDIDDGTVGIELTYFYDGQPRTLFLRQDQIAVISELIKLANFGVPVTSANAYATVEYLANQQATSMSTLPEALTTSHGGWIEFEGTHYFSFGAKVIAPNGAKPIARKMPSELPKAIKFVGVNKGDRQEWIKAFKKAKGHKLVLFQLGCALLAPLLHVLQIHPFTVHFHDDSTTGKTVALRLALSIFGNPNDGCYLATWETTEVGVENLCAALNNLPVGLDDSSLAKSPGLITHCLYMIGNGSGRSRGTQAGGAREAKSFTVTVLSNGEGFLIHATSYTGQTVRTIQVKRNPWDLNGAADIAVIETIVKENFGFLGPIYLQLLVNIMNDPVGLKALRLKHSEAIGKLKNTKTNKLVGRTLPMLAGAEIALKLAVEAMPELEATAAEIDASIAEVLRIQNESLNETSTTAFKAFQYVIDQIQANPGRFTRSDSCLYDDDKVRDIWGISVKRVSNIELVDGYAFISSQLYKLLREGGFDSEAVCHQFRERRWVILDQKNYLPNVKIDGKSDRRFVFDMALAEQIGALVPDEEGL